MPDASASPVFGNAKSLWPSSVGTGWFWKVTSFVDDETDHIRRSFLSNFVLDDHCRGRSRAISVMGFPILEWKKGKKDKVKILNWRPFWWDNSAVLLSKIVESVPRDCDDIYICRHNIGETFIHLSLVDQAITTNKSKKPTLIVRKKEYISLYEMLAPKSAYIIYIPILRSDLDDHVEGSFYFHNRRIISGKKDILDRLQCEKSRCGTANFVNFMRSDLGLHSSAQMRDPAIREASQKKLRHKMERIGLDLNKFILLTPEASTIREIDQSFWTHIIKLLSAEGFSIYVNHLLPTVLPHPLKTATLNIEEVYLLAREAKGIIGVASGLNVLLSATGTPMDIMYTDTGGGCSATEILDLFSMQFLPGYTQGKIREHNTETMTMDVIAADIVGRYS